MHIETAHSTFIDQLFAGKAQLDSAFIMRNLQHTWTPCGTEHFDLGAGDWKQSVPIPALAELIEI